MLFTDYTKFDNSDTLFCSNDVTGSESKFYEIKFKNGEVFKQITTFEELCRINRDKSRSSSRYGAWFVSNKDSLFLTAEEINELMKENKVEYIRRYT